MPEPCQECGKQATMNYQLVWVSWHIKQNGEIETDSPTFKNCEENEWYCNRCYAKEILRWSEEELNRVYGEVSE